MREYIQIFGYGSLINENSLRKTTPNAYDIIPCYIKGFHREFNISTEIVGNKKRISPISVLNIQNHYNENHFINGVTFKIPTSEYNNLGSRIQS